MQYLPALDAVHAVYATYHEGRDLSYQSISNLASHLTWHRVHVQTTVPDLIWKQSPKKK